MAQPYLLAAGVDDDEIGRGDDQLPEGIQRADGQGVDEIESLGGGDLDQAEAGMIGVLADELGIQPKAPAGGEMLTAGGQLFGLGDELFR